MNVALFLAMCVAALLALAEGFPQQKKPDFSYHPPPPPNKPLNGGVTYGADHTRGGGINAHINGHQEVYNNGKTRAEVYGGYDRNFGGPGNGQWNGKVGGRVEHTWGK